jgi:hypothetical protein
LVRVNRHDAALQAVNDTMPLQALKKLAGALYHFGLVLSRRLRGSQRRGKQPAVALAV